METHASVMEESMEGATPPDDADMLDAHSSVVKKVVKSADAAVVTDPKGIIMGFAPFDDHAIKRGVASLAIALSKRES